MIRAATPADVPVLREMIVELAAYERSAEQVEVTGGQLHAALFDPHPAVFALIAEEPRDAAGSAAPGGAGDPAGTEPARTVGFALWFRNFSTWTGKPGIYVRPPAQQPGGTRRSANSPCYEHAD